MRSNHSFAINFIKRNCSANKQKALLYVRITLDGERVEISLKEQVNVSDWDGHREILRGKTVQVKQINQHIEDVRYQLKEKYRLLQEERSLLTADRIKQAYLEMYTEQKGHTLNELLNYYIKIWEPKLKKGGFKNYKTTIRYIELLLKLKYPKEDIYLSQVNREFATELEHFIRMTPIKAHNPCLGNGVGKHMQRFKRILNWAADDLGWMKENGCKNYKCPLKKSKRKKMDNVELVKLETKQFYNPALLYISELFIYSCYTGLAFIDAMNLTGHDFEWDAKGVVWCKIYRTKSDEMCAIPLLKPAALILNKYREDAKIKNRSTIFPPISNKHVNESLKTIQAACEITTYLTFHVARHTFAKTIALKNGIPLETVQMMLGHTKITTTQIYADVDEEKILMDFKGLDEKIERNRQIILDNQALGNTM